MNLLIYWQLSEMQALLVTYAANRRWGIETENSKVYRKPHYLQKRSVSN